MERYPIVILGGGAAALGAAYHLVKHGIRPVILEKSSQLGGLAGSYHINRYFIEKFYHHFFPTDTVIFQLAKELGLEKSIMWRKAPMGFYYNKKLYGFTSPLDILRFEPLLFANRLKFGLTMLKISRQKHFKELDKKNAKEWLVEEFGAEIYQKIFEPLLKVKFAMSLDKASAAFVYGRLHARAESRTKNIGAEKLGYMEGGYHSLLEAMRKKIEKKSVVSLSTEIKDVTYNKNQKTFNITVQRGKKRETIVAAHIINTFALEIFARLAKSFPHSLMQKIRKIQYQAIICAAIGLRRKLSDYYWINISSADVPFHGVIEHTNFIPSRMYHNTHIAYLFNYVTPEHTFWTMNENKLKKEYINGLKKMFPHIAEKDILWFRLAKERFATPIFLQGYKENMEAIDSFNNLHFAGSFKIYPHSRNINNVIRTGIEAADKALSSHISQ
jgi:protoporphyrinogen oxidase